VLTAGVLATTVLAAAVLRGTAGTRTSVVAALAL